MSFSINYPSRLQAEIVRRVPSPPSAHLFAPQAPGSNLVSLGTAATGG